MRAFVFAQSDPALENCSDVSFAPFNFAYAGLEQHLRRAGLSFDDPAANRWSQVFDFNQRPEGAGHNWRLLDPADFRQVQKQVAYVPDRRVACARQPRALQLRLRRHRARRAQGRLGRLQREEYF